MSPLAHNGSTGPSELDMELDENDTDGTESTASKVSAVIANMGMYKQMCSRDGRYTNPPSQIKRKMRASSVDE